MINVTRYGMQEGLIEIHCPMCGVVSYVCDWVEKLIVHECCDHDAAVCPTCEDWFDEVFERDYLIRANP